MCNSKLKVDFYSSCYTEAPTACYYLSLLSNCNTVYVYLLSIGCYVLAKCIDSKVSVNVSNV